MSSSLGEEIVGLIRTHGTALNLSNSCSPEEKVFCINSFRNTDTDALCFLFLMAATCNTRGESPVQHQRLMLKRGSPCCSVRFVAKKWKAFTHA